MLVWPSSGTRQWVIDAIAQATHDRLLESFYETDSLSLSLKSSNMITPDQFRFFLDSGAYSAWSKGTKIDLDEYCHFIRANIEQIEVYASLDCIPGAPGRNATPDERERAAAQSWANYIYMVNDGLDPIPVYHYGEHPKHLERMLDYGCQYIGIGGLVGVPGPKRKLWLDEIFDRLVDDSGQPTVKTHGFGMTAIPLIFRYPWYSVDSTTWIQVTANGAIYLPAVKAGEFVFDEVPSLVVVSSSNPKAMQDGKHYNSLPANIQTYVRKWLEFCGKTLAGVQESYRHRATCNVMFFKMVSEHKVNKPYQRSKAPRATAFF